MFDYAQAGAFVHYDCITISLAEGIFLISQINENCFIEPSDVGSHFPGFGYFVFAAYRHTEHLMPFTTALASSLPPESRTILSNSLFGG